MEKTFFELKKSPHLNMFPYRRSGAQTIKPDSSTMDAPTATLGIATDRMDNDEGIMFEKQVHFINSYLQTFP